MTFKVIESAQARQRAVNAPGLVAIVCTGHASSDVLVEREPLPAA